MNFQTLKDYFQEFIECNQHKIMFLNGKDDIFEEFKVIDAINFLEEKDKEIERLNNIINELEEYICAIEYDERNSECWEIPVRIHNKLQELKGNDNK